MKMFKRIVAIILLSSASIANAQWAVIDAAALIEWANQLKAMKDQLDHMKEVQRSFTGTRGLEQLVNNPALRRYLPKDYQQILNSGFGNSQQIRSQYKRFGIDQAKVFVDKDTKDHFNHNADFAATNRATTEEAYKQASRRFDDLDVLLNKLKTSNDPKDVADLQARIGAEQAILQNENNKISMLNALAQAEDRLQEQQAKEIHMKASSGKIPRY